MRRQPLLIMLICFVAGILADDRTGAQSSSVYLLAGIGLLAVGLGYIRNYWLQILRPFFLGFFFFGIGVLTMHLHSRPAGIQTFNGKQTLIFNLDKKLNSSEKYRRYEVDVLKVKNAAPAPFKAVISVPRDIAPLDFRHHYQVQAYINTVRPPDNDFQFNYARYLQRKQIHHQIFISEEPLKSERRELSFSDQVRQQRLKVLERINVSGLSPKTREFLKGIILADRTEMDAGTVADFSRSGLVHLLAISGSHMVIIFGLILLLFKSVFPAKFRSLSFVVALLAIWSFAIFIDYGSSVVRSCIMITAFYLFVLLQRKTDLLHAMALAAFSILLVDPHQLFDVGFQLSFAAVLGIFWLNQPILSYFGDLTSKPKRFFANVISVSLSAQLVTLPLVLLYFHQYSAISVVANVVVIPFSEVIIILSLLMSVLLAFNIEFTGLNVVFDALVQHLLQLIHWFAAKDFAFSERMPMVVSEAAALLFAVYLLRNLLVKKNDSSAIRFAGALLLFLALRLGLNFVHFNRDEVLLTENFKDKVLIAKNGNTAVFYVNASADSEKVAKYVVAPYLASRRISEFKIQKIPTGTRAVAVRGKTYDLD